MKKTQKRLFALLLSVVMAVSLLPISVWAAWAEELTPETPAGEEVSRPISDQNTPEAPASGDSPEGADLLAAAYNGSFTAADLVPPTIPGWRQQTSTTLDPSRKYIIVTQNKPATGATPTYYLLYPSSTGTSQNAGAGIEANGALVASLVVGTDRSVTVTHMAASSPDSNLTLASCQFSPVATSTSGRWSFKFDNNNYLALHDKTLSTNAAHSVLTLADNPLGHGAFYIKGVTKNRALDFNVPGNVEFVNNNTKYHLNFWGPSASTSCYPFYLYYYVGDGVFKGDLDAAITAAQALTQSHYTTTTWAAVSTALTTAQSCQSSTSATQEQVDSAVAALNAAVAALEEVPVTLTGYTQVKTMSALTDGYYVVVVRIPGSSGSPDRYIALYPGATAQNVANAKALTVGSDNALAFPSGSTAEAAENGFSKMGSTYKISAVGPNSTPYLLCLAGNGKIVYQPATGNTSTITVTLENAEKGYFKLKGPLNSFLLYVDASRFFGQGSSLSNGWYADIMLFRNNTKAPPNKDFGVEVADMFTPAASSSAPYDNSWVFTGGRAVQGQLADIGDVRSFMGQFEEYIRWTGNSQTSSGHNGMQRFTINTAKAGQTLHDIVTNFQDRVSRLDPRAVVYLVGPEDMAAATVPEQFKTDLKSFIDQALTLRDNTGFAIIMKPYTNATNATAYSQAVDEVIQQHYQNDYAHKGRILTIDGQNLTNKVNAVEMDGSLGTRNVPNAAGHTALALALVQKFYGNPLPANKQLQAVDTTNYTHPDDSSHVSTYDEYLLPSYSATPENQLTTAQRKVKTMVENKSQALTWLFMGDSITHGALWLAGHDSIAQMFEKFVKEDLARPGDVVVNTGCSGSIASQLVGNNLSVRMTKYSADIIAVMIGTNDSGSPVPDETYKTHLQTIISNAKEGAVVVLRTPPPGYGFNATRVATVQRYARIMKELAAANPDKVILVDQYNQMAPYVLKDDTAPSFLYNKLYANNNIHPGPIGHLWMTRMLIDGLGLWNDSYKVCQHRYYLGIPTLTASHTYDVASVITHIPAGNNTTTLAVDIDALDDLFADAKSVLAGELIATVDGTEVKGGATRGGTASITIPKTSGMVDVTVKVLAHRSATNLASGYFTFQAQVNLDTPSPADSTIVLGDWALAEGNGTIDTAPRVNASNRLLLPAGGSNETLRNNSQVPIFTNQKLNNAIQTTTAANKTRYVNFNVWVNVTAGGTANFGFAINANKLYSNTKAYYIGYDNTSQWFVEIYDGANGTVTRQPINGLQSATVSSGTQLDLKIQWDNDTVRFFYNGEAYTLPQCTIPADPTVVVKSGVMTSLTLSDLSYSGDGGLDLYVLNTEINNMLRYQEQKEVYVASTWTAAETALNSALALRTAVGTTNFGGKTQADVDAAAAALTTARAGLVYLITGTEQPPTGSHTVYQDVSELDYLTSGDTYALWSANGSGILHLPANGTITNQCRNHTYNSVTGQMSDIDPHNNDKTHLLTLTYDAAHNGWSIQSRATGGRYLTSTISGTQLALSTTPEYFQISVVPDGVEITNQSGKFLAFTNTTAHYWNAVNARDTANGTTTFKLFKQTLVDYNEAVIRNWRDMIPESGQTEGQPFVSEVSGKSENFRVPAMITLKHQTNASKNGRVLAVTDARWNHTSDSMSPDTLVSYSDDSGAHWSYQYANYFGDSTNAENALASAFVYPVLVEAANGDVFLMADVWPGGVSLSSILPANSTGYQEVNGRKRMVLYVDPDNQTDVSWSYYVTDFVNGYADICQKGTTQATDYYLDQYFYLYRKTGATRNPDTDKIYCQRLGSAEWVQQNVFFRNSVLHVRKATYLWVVKSTDGGETWSSPSVINGQVRTVGSRFYGGGSGNGLSFVHKDGSCTVMLPTYLFWTGELTSMRSGFIYSSDGGQSWKSTGNATQDNGTPIWSSESSLVQINFTTVRQFFRSPANTLWYTDYTLNESTGVWTPGVPVDTHVADNVGSSSNGCQISAIRYSQRIDGKPAILVAHPANETDRTKGVLDVFLVETDAGHTLTHLTSYQITDASSSFHYSTLTELNNGSVSVLYDVDGTAPTYVNVPIQTIVGSSLVGNQQIFAISKEAPTEVHPTNAYKIYEYMAQPDATDRNGLTISDYVTVTYEPDGTLRFTAVREGTLVFTIDQAFNATESEEGGVEVILRITEESHLDAGDWRLVAANAAVGTHVTVSDDGESYLLPGAGSGGYKGSTTTAVYENAALNTALAAATGERYVSFTARYITPNTSNPRHGFILNATDANNGYFFGFDTANTSMWYVDVYNAAVANGTASYRKLSGLRGGLANGDRHDIRLQWNQGGEVRLWFDGVEQSDAPNLCGLTFSPKFAIQVTSGTTVALSNLHYSGDGLPDTYLLEKAVRDARLLNQTDYAHRPALWAAMQTALDAATLLLRNPVATQASIDAAATALSDAVFELSVVRDWRELAPADGTSARIPFPFEQVAGATCFRIPGLVTLSDGALLATADIRYHTISDGMGVDSIVSISHDNGANWSYSVFNHFGDAANDMSHNNSAAYAANLIDPIVAVDSQDNIYFMADAFPAGTATMNGVHQGPSTDTGFTSEEINGAKRLMVYNTPESGSQNTSSYVYYVGDRAAGSRYAPLMDKTTNQPSLYYVDDFFYLYKKANSSEPMDGRNGHQLFCRQIVNNSSGLTTNNLYVQQNLFFYLAELHVRCSTYLWLRKGHYNAAARTITWEAPKLLNDQVRRAGDPRFFGACPGRGISFLYQGHERVVLPCYVSAPEKASMIWTEDGGITWHRGDNLPAETSESALVAVGEVLYLFARHTNNYFVSTDGGQTWSSGIPSGKDWNNGTQINAVTYSQLVNGKPAIILSVPTVGENYASRKGGFLYTFLVDEETNTLSLLNECRVNANTEWYGYSSLSEITVSTDGVPAGSIALIYEDTHRDDGRGHPTIQATIGYEAIPIERLIPSNAVVGNMLPLALQVDGPATIAPLSGSAQTLKTAIEGNADAAALVNVYLATAGNKLVAIGKAEGTAELTVGSGPDAFTVTLAVNGRSTPVPVTLTAAGATQSFTIPDGSILSYVGNYDAVDVDAGTQAALTTVTGSAKAQLATANNTFNGSTVSLAQALYYFQPVDGGFRVVYEGGAEKIYLNTVANSAGYPQSTLPTTIQFEAVTNANYPNSFFIKDVTPADGASTRYLHFSNGHVFDRETRGQAPNDHFFLYRPARAGETADTTIPGYVMVTQLNDITEGHYLIVATRDNISYVLYPSLSTSSKFAHTAKVDATQTTPTETVRHPYTGATFQGLQRGSADVVVGSTLYRVTVTGDAVIVREPTPEASVDYTAEKLTGLTPHGGYTANGVSVTADAAGAIAIDSAWLGATLALVNPTSDTARRDSAPLLLPLAARPSTPVANALTAASPTAQNAADGSIAGITSAMEYSTDNGQTWTSSTGDTVTGLVGGTQLQIRVKATANNPVSNPVTVTIPVYTGTSSDVIHPTRVTLSTTSATLYTNRAPRTLQLTAAITPANATDQAVTWSSSNPSAATVSSTGLVTAVASGTTIITATTHDGALTAQCQVTVTARVPGPNDILVSRIALNTVSVVLYSNYGSDVFQLTASITPANATDRTVTWTSSNPNVATVDKNGLVEMVGSGTAVITVTANDGSEISASCNVTVTTYSGSGTGGRPSDTISTGAANQPSVTVDDNGTKTTTVTDRTGAKTETVERPDGTVTEIVTAPDGTVTKTLTDPDHNQVVTTMVPNVGTTVVVTGAEGDVRATMFLPTVIPAPADPFTDIPDDHWSRRAADNMAGLGIIQGTAKNIFSGNMAMTRGMMATALHRLSGNLHIGPAHFKDTEDGKYYTDSVDWAATAGIINGVSMDEYEPNRDITRQELATMLYRYAKFLGMDTTVQPGTMDSFSDGAQVGDWAADAMGWAASAGLIQGRVFSGVTALAPTSLATRAEVVTILSRFIDLLK